MDCCLIGIHVNVDCIPQTRKPCILCTGDAIHSVQVAAINGALVQVAAIISALVQFGRYHWCSSTVGCYHWCSST